jgi:hypothetical protein
MKIPPPRRSLPLPIVIEPVIPGAKSYAIPGLWNVRAFTSPSFQWMSLSAPARGLQMQGFAREKEDLNVLINPDA